MMLFIKTLFSKTKEPRDETIEALENRIIELEALVQLQKETYFDQVDWIAKVNDLEAKNKDLNVTNYCLKTHLGDQSERLKQLENMEWENKKLFRELEKEKHQNSELERLLGVLNITNKDLNLARKKLEIMDLVDTFPKKRIQY